VNSAIIREMRMRVVCVCDECMHRSMPVLPTVCLYIIYGIITLCRTAVVGPLQ
jgi:hypothetical protein